MIVVDSYADAGHMTPGAWRSPPNTGVSKFSIAEGVVPLLEQHDIRLGDRN